MDIIDLLSSYDVSRELKHLLVDILADNPELSVYDLVLTPRATNDDLNGSQHANGGGNDFTYEDAPMEAIWESPLTFGVYDHFAKEGGHYTGHSYEGEGRRFAALVVNPPAYAVGYSL